MDAVKAQLSQLPFWDRLTTEQQDDMARSTTIQPFRKGSMVHSCGSECLGLVLVQTGSVRAYLLSQEGREVTLFQLDAGDVCTLSAACVVDQIAFDTQMTALEDCQVLAVNSGCLQRLMGENLHARCFVYETATQRFTDVMESMQRLLFLGVDQRLADFLLRASAPSESPEIRITHEQIAQQISSAREVVARMLKKFSAQGLVEVRRGSIRILDRKGLEKLNP